MNSLNKMDLIDLYYPAGGDCRSPPRGATKGARSPTPLHSCPRVRHRGGSAYLSESGNDRCICR